MIHTYDEFRDLEVTFEIPWLREIRILKIQDQDMNDVFLSEKDQDELMKALKKFCELNDVYDHKTQMP
jgi:hypothetical protein